MNSIVDRSAFNQNCIELSPIHFFFQRTGKEKKTEKNKRKIRDESSAIG
jgi:hypothetical protein